MRKNLAAARVAILTQLEYRFNFVLDAFIQPILVSSIEVALWMAILSGMSGGSLGGFGREHYLAYALWANFLGRVTTNWMFEFTMLENIDTGKVNSILARPISFYEFFLFQFMGYKLLVAVLSFAIPVTACWLLGGSMMLERLPLMFLLVAYFLVFVHTISFCVACLAFFINRAYSFTAIKNMALWVLAGELIPLDLYPEPLKSWLIHSPFASGVYIPVGYLTGRFGPNLMAQSFVSVTAGIAGFSILARLLWRRGLQSYTGTGA